MKTKDIAIVGIIILESIALITHTDGAFFMPVVIIIAGLAGYELGLKKKESQDG